MNILKIPLRTYRQTFKDFFKYIQNLKTCNLRGTVRNITNFSLFLRNTKPT